MGFNIVNYWMRNADNLLIAKFVGASALGYYNRAYNLMLLPVQQISQVLGRVMFPALSSMGDDHARVRTAYIRALLVINVLAVPVLVTMAATAPALVPFLWGSQWEKTVPLLQILAIAGVPQCMAVSGGWLYQSQGRTDLMFRMGLWTSAVGVATMAYGLKWGATGVAVAVLARSWILTPITLRVPCRLVGLPLRRLLRANLPTLAAAAFAGGAAWSAPLAVGLARTSPAALGVQLVVAGVLYVGAVWLIQRPVVEDVLDVARRRGS